MIHLLLSLSFESLFNLIFEKLLLLLDHLKLVTAIELSFHALLSQLCLERPLL